MKNKPHPSVFAILFFFGVAALYYRVFPSIASTTYSFTSSIFSSLQNPFQNPSLCAKDIGDGICCSLHLEAEPCLDDCRKFHVDRETFTLTKEYEICADMCLADYRLAVCGRKNTVRSLEGVVKRVEETEVRRARRRRRTRSPTRT